MRGEGLGREGAHAAAGVPAHALSPHAEGPAAPQAGSGKAGRQAGDRSAVRGFTRQVSPHHAAVPAGPRGQAARRRRRHLRVSRVRAPTRSPAVHAVPPGVPDGGVLSPPQTYRGARHTHGTRRRRKATIRRDIALRRRRLDGPRDDIESRGAVVWRFRRGRHAHRLRQQAGVGKGGGFRQGVVRAQGHRLRRAQDRRGQEGRDAEGAVRG